ncbi:MAG: DUF4330 domain-containing protein [Oscillospiraceae bacterium]|nr:DUF4330 domain-containing protein [Oscillospiraceae bacterium]
MKIKINILDWIIIGVLVLALLFVGYQACFSTGGIFEQPTITTVEYQMEFRRMTPEFASAISIGDRVYTSARERDEAEVVDVLALPARTIELNRLTGEYIIAEIPRHYDVIVTVRVDAVENDREFRNGGTAIRVGAECVMRGQGYAAEGFIINMRLYGEEWFGAEVTEEYPGYEYPEYPDYNGYGEAYNGEGGDE